jgi:hypothetical protein
MFCCHLHAGNKGTVSEGDSSGNKLCSNKLNSNFLKETGLPKVFPFFCSNKMYPYKICSYKFCFNILCSDTLCSNKLCSNNMCSNNLCCAFVVLHT